MLCVPRKNLSRAFHSQSRLQTTHPGYYWILGSGDIWGGAKKHCRITSNNWRVNKRQDNVVAQALLEKAIADRNPNYGQALRRFLATARP